MEGGIVHTSSNRRQLVKTNLCVRQVGPYLVRALIFEGVVPSTGEDRNERTSGLPAVLPRAALGSYVRCR